MTCMLPKCILHLSISLHLHCWHIKLNASLWWPPATVSYSYSCFPSIYFSQGSQNNLKNNKSDHITTLFKTQCLLPSILHITSKFLFIAFKVFILHHLVSSCTFNHTLFHFPLLLCISHTCIILFLITHKVSRSKRPCLVSVYISHGTEESI